MQGVTEPPTKAKFVVLCAVTVVCGLAVGHGVVGDVGAWVLLAGIFVLARYVL